MGKKKFNINHKRSDNLTSGVRWLYRELLGKRKCAIGQLKDSVRSHLVGGLGAFPQKI